MARLPRLNAKEIIALLLERGFVEARQTGSHKVFYHSEGKRTVVPFHGSKILHPKLIKDIFKQAGIDVKNLL